MDKSVPTSIPSILGSVQELFAYAIRKRFPDIPLDTSIITVQWSEHPEHGDISTNAPLRLAPLLKKKPLEIAIEIQEFLNHERVRISHNMEDHSSNEIDQKGSTEFPQTQLLQGIKSIEAVAPGFLNVSFDDVFFGTYLQRLLKLENPILPVPSKFGRKVIVEYTDPNPFKEFHIGHLYSNTVGESVARLEEAVGAKVKRADYFGDVGMHVAKTVYGLGVLAWKGSLVPLTDTDTGEFFSALTAKSADKLIAEFEKDLLPQRIKTLGQAYAYGATAYQDHPASAEIMKDLNYLIYISAQAYITRTYGWKPRIDYRQYVDPTKLQTQTLDAVATLYSRGREWSLAYFETIYHRLGTQFDFYFPESEVGEVGYGLVRGRTGQGGFEESDGAIVFRGDKVGLHTRVFINSLGLPTYETKELGLAVRKSEVYPYDDSIIVTGNEINEYFQVLMAALADIRPDLAAKTTHIGHGMVRNADGSKMSSRSGKVLSGEGLIDEAKRLIIRRMEQSTVKSGEVDVDQVAEALAVASIKYALLRPKIGSDVRFDFDKVIAVEGDSGPYLVYTYARCRSVLKKASATDGSVPVAPDTESGIVLNPEERRVAGILIRLPDIISQAAAAHAPNTICTYVYDLAQAFNQFYTQHQILPTTSPATLHGAAIHPLSSGNGVERMVQFRLWLTDATARSIKQALHLLGIPVVESM